MLYETKLNHEVGLNVDEANRLAGRRVFIVSAAENEPDGVRALRVLYPMTVLAVSGQPV